ncbi:MAG: hypothetical protein H6747_10240 [Deltaproteobacteria bacterium]|nr:hypothetical protein [Deltaproteobacteria bacterium]
MAQQGNEQSNVVDLAAWRVKVRGSSSHGSQRPECALREVRPDGVVLEGADEGSLGRYVWLDVDLPGGGEVKALGEVVGRRDPRQLALDVKFKHLFPDHRRALQAALGG